MANRLALFDNVSVCQGRYIERCVTYECACMSRFHYVDRQWLVHSVHGKICCSVVVETNKEVLHRVLLFYNGLQAYGFAVFVTSSSTASAVSNSEYPCLRDVVYSALHVFNCACFEINISIQSVLYYLRYCFFVLVTKLYNEIIYLR